MLSLSVLVWLTLLALLAAFWWHSDFVKNEALRLASDYCQGLELQLLDQSMVIKGIFPQRDAAGRLCFRRTYRFEFTSTGEERYKGQIVMVGRNKSHIELAPHAMP